MYIYFVPYKVGFGLGIISKLTLPLCLASEYLVEIGPTFSQVMNHMRAVEQTCFDTFYRDYQVGNGSLPLQPVILIKIMPKGP